MGVDDEIFEYVLKNLKNINESNTTFMSCIKEKAYSDEAKKIFSIGCKQIRNKTFREYFGFVGQITSKQYWVSRGWDDNKLCEYQQTISKIAVKVGAHKGRFSEDWFKNKYGDEQGVIKYNDLKNDRSMKNKKDYQVKTKGENSWKNQLDNKAQTERNFKKRYGEQEGEKKFKEFVMKSKQTKENFIIRYGEELGILKWNNYIIKQQFNSSEDAWVIKFGSEGKSLRKEFFTKTLGSGDKFSKISKKLFDDVAENIEGVCYYGEYEKTIDCAGGKRVLKPDFLYNNKIVEFYGDFWHANPLKYNSTDEIKMPGRKEQKAIDIWSRDKERLNLLSSAGFEYFIVWESEYKDSPELTVTKILDFLNR